MCITGEKIRCGSSLSCAVLLTSLTVGVHLDGLAQQGFAERDQDDVNGLLTVVRRTIPDRPGCTPRNKHNYCEGHNKRMFHTKICSGQASWPPLSINIASCSLCTPWLWTHAHGCVGKTSYSPNEVGMAPKDDDDAV